MPITEAGKVYVKGPLFGGSGGEAFEDFASDLKRLSAITVRAARYVDAIRCTWTLSNGEIENGPWHGGSGGEIYNINLAPDEYVIRILGRSASYLDQITFITNKGRTFGPYGGDGGQAFQWDVPSYVAAFYGRAASYIDALGGVYPER